MLAVFLLEIEGELCAFSSFRADWERFFGWNA